ncbi:MAG: hypothetical protein GY941_05985 [Planctomycetes bacterium]|nr:hypothetical protein [Planctomycetota bacterium]
MIETLLTVSKSPLTSQQIRKRVFKPGNGSENCDQSIRTLLNEEKIFSYPSLRKNSKKRYWHIAPQKYVKDKIYRLFEKDSKDRTFKSVKGTFRKWELQFFDEALDQLLRERNIFEVKYGRSRYLKGIQKLSLELADWFNPIRCVQLTPAEWQTFLKGEKVTDTQTTQKDTKARLEDSQIRKWYQEDRHKRYGLETIPIKWTGNRYLKWCRENGYEADIGLFTSHLKDLSQKGKVELTHHSMPDQIPEDERVFLFEIRHGTIAYYWRYVEES